MSNTKIGAEVDWPAVGRYGAAGAALGGGTAALLNLVHHINAKRRENEARQKLQNPQLDEDTIVINLPPKAGAVAGTAGEPTTIRSKESSVSSETSARKQIRHPDGQYGDKTASVPQSELTLKLAQATWPTLTMAGLAGIAGTAAGAKLVDSIYEKQLEARLKKKLEQAQQEYMSALSNKVAGFDDVLFDTPLVKQASPSLFGMLNYPIGFGALAAIIGTGGAGYLTKRILDERDREVESRGKDVPALKRIVFRTTPATDEAIPEEAMKEAADTKVTSDDVEAIEASLGVMMDKLSHRTVVLNVPEVKVAMREAGMTNAKMFKLANDADNLINYFMAPENAHLRRLTQRAAMDKHPMYSNFKWALNLPGISGMADRRLRSGLQSAFAQPPAVPKAASVVGDFIGGIAGGSALGHLQGGKSEAPTVDPQALAAAIAAAQQEAKEKSEANDPNNRAAAVKVMAADPESAAYVSANQQRIKRLLVDMARQKKL